MRKRRCLGSASFREDSFVVEQTGHRQRATSESGIFEKRSTRAKVEWQRHILS